MSKLSDVTYGCDLLNSKRITEQGKGLIELKRLLEDEKVRLSITKSHKGKRNPNWNTICNTVSDYLRKECDGFAKNQNSWSDATRANKTKKLMDTFRFLKQVLRIASSEEVKLDLVSLLEYLVELLHEDIFVVNFGISMLKILNDAILINRKVSAEVQKASICELLNFCERKMCAEDEKMKFDVSTVLVSLTKIIVKNTDFVDNLQFHDIYSRIVESLDKIKAYSVIENVLTATIHYIKWSSLTHRELCCSFGEEGLHYILKLWRENFPNNTLQYITSFCLLQISLHHPDMVVDSSVGYYSKNHEAWCSKLYSMVIAADLVLHKQQSGMQYRFKNSKTTSYDEGCVRLVGEASFVIFKMMQKGTFVMPKKVISCKSFASSINFDNLSSILTQFNIAHNKTIENIGKPWFAVLSVLLVHHASLFNYDLLISILAKFHHLLMNASFESLGPHGVNVIRNSLLLVSCRNRHLSRDGMSKLSAIWKDFWNVAVSCLVTTGKDTNTCAIKFLDTLLEFDKRTGKNFYISTGISKSAKSFWSTIYLQVSPSVDSISLSTKLLQLYGIQCDENAMFGTVLQTTPINREFIDCDGYENLHEKNILKLLILHWLLGFKMEDGNEKQTNQTSTQPYQFANKNDCKPTATITPNVFCKMYDFSNLVEAVSELLAAVSYKDSKGSENFLSHQSDEFDMKDIAEIFLKPDFVTSFQYFNFEGLPWFKRHQKSNPEFANLPRCDTTSDVIFSILFCNMNLIVNNAKSFSSNTVSKQYLKLFQSFFLYTNTLGNLLCLHHEHSEFSSKYSEKWIKLVIKFVNAALLLLEKKNLVITDDALTEISVCLSTFLEIFSKEPFRQIVKTKTSIESQLLHPMYAFFKNILHQFHSDGSKTELNQEESPDSHDDVLGLTQTMASSSSAGCGYKRRKYNMEAEPPIKQSRLSDTIGRPTIRTNADDIDKSGLILNHQFVRNIVKFATSIQSSFQFDDATRDILKIALELDPAHLSDLCCIYTILDQLCMAEGSLSYQCINDMLDIYHDVFSVWYKDQEISLKFLVLFAKITCRIVTEKLAVSDGDVTKRINTIVGIFWDLKSSNKCSHLTRMGISACVLANIPISSQAISQNLFEKIQDLLSDPHASVKGLTIFILAKFQSLRQNSVFEGHECDFLAFITQLTCQARTNSAVESSETLSLLGTSLHCVFVCLPSRSHDVEVEAHYLLCVIESILRRLRTSLTCSELCTRSISWISKQTFDSVFNFTMHDNLFRSAYSTRHLSKSLFRWITSNPRKLMDKIESFPCTLYGYGDMKTLCCNFVKKTFPAILCAVHSHEELTAIHETYFYDADNGNSINSLILLCLPEIFQMQPPNENLNHDVVELLDDIYQKSNCYQYLLTECLGHVLVDLFMQNNSDTTIQSKLNHIARILQNNGNKPKLALNTDLITILSELVFCKRKFTLADMFTRIRHHFENSWFGHEYKQCTETYFNMVSLLLKGSKIPETSIPYVVNDVVSLVTLNFTEVELKMSNAALEDHFQSGVESMEILVKLVTKVSLFLHQYWCQAQETTGVDRIALLIVNLLLKAEQFYEKVCDFGVPTTDNFHASYGNLATVVKSLSERTNFHKFHIFVDESENPSIKDCTEALKECYDTFDGLRITKFNNPIVNKICDTVVANLRIENVLTDAATQKRLIESVLIMLNIMKTQIYQNLPLADAIIEIYMHVSNLPVSINSITALQNPNQLHFSNIMTVLIGAVNSKSSDISSTALTCLKDLVKIPELKGLLLSVTQHDGILDSILTLLKLESSRKLPVISHSIEHLKDSLHSIENMPDQSSLICSFTTCMIGFCRKALFHSLKPLCNKMEKISALILPSVVHDILLHDPTQKAKKELSRFFKACFKREIDQPRQQYQQMSVFLDVMQYLRSQDISEINAQFQKHARPGAKSTSWDNNFWLDIDYKDLARVALTYDQPYMAVLYAEIWKETLEHKSTLTKPGTCRSLSKALCFLDQNSPITLDKVQTPQDNDELMNEILTKAYCKIEDVDGLYGLAGNSWNPALMMHIHSMESNWFKALEDFNILMTRSNSSSASDGIIQCLQWLGLTHLAETYKNTRSLKPIIDDQYVQDVCQLGKWDNASSNKSFPTNLDQCQSYLQDYHPSFDSVISSMWNGVVSSFENDTSLLNVFGSKMLNCVGQLTVIRDLLFARKFMLGANGEDVTAEKCIEKLSLSEIPLDASLLSSYSCAESIIINRNKLVGIMTSTVKSHSNDAAAQNLIRGNLALQIDLAIRSNRGKMALQMIESAMSGLAISYNDVDVKTNEEYHRFLLKKAQVLWNADRKIHALSVASDLRHVLELCLNGDNMDKTHVRYHLAKVLQLSGVWIYEMKMESPSTIMENYLQQSVNVASRPNSNQQDSNSPSTKAKFDKLHVSGYKTLAKFADAQYREVVEYMTSKEFEHKRNLAREAKQEISKTSSKPVTDQNRKYYVLLQKNYKLDHRDFTNILDQKEKFLLCAVENYIKCLSLSDEDDLLMYRICALWFENTQSASLPGLMQCACSELKSHKFVDISYQLAARLDKKCQDKNFQSTLCKLLKNLAVDHPHHVLPVLFALAHAHHDAGFSKVRQKRMASITDDATSEAAQSIIDVVKKVKPQLVTRMGSLSEAYIEFANCDVSKYSKTLSTPISFEKNLLLAKYCDSRIKDKYAELVIPTIEIPIDKNGNYQSILQSASLSYFKPYFQLCGGINLPKIAVAIASDGSERKHLVKGRDDLRQDAVMQHVFKVVNALLIQNEGPQNLRMCTYKVVPLSQRSGLVEWCEGTIPIGNYLIGVPAQQNFGAHHLYRPKDLISGECRKKLSAANGKSHRQKLDVYRDICQKFKPVFRNFFYDNFVAPDRWFQCKTAYCKSVSISSIVGYILGLGDRHVQNILINQSTGEVIHIDLGVAFEQGKCLPTPEMVPFRLTRDLVDAFGSSGVEGSFRRNCERCLRVLRSSIDVIATIVEVLLHDPLHDWMMTSDKAMQVQRDEASNMESEMTSSVLNASTVAELLQNEVASTASSNSRSSLAGRALLRVKEKLRGLESGSILSVEGQVNMLIQQATDEERLCAMFVGWQPYI